MANTKVQWSGKINIEKKKLVERKRKLISASTGCNRAYSYMASQEVLLLEYRNVRISTSCKQWLATCSLLVLYKKSSTRSPTTWATCRDKKMQFKPQHQMLTLETRYQWLLNWTGPSEYHAHPQAPPCKRFCRRQWHLSGLLRITFQRLQITEGP